MNLIPLRKVFDHLVVGNTYTLYDENSSIGEYVFAVHDEPAASSTWVRTNQKGSGHLVFKHKYADITIFPSDRYFINKDELNWVAHSKKKKKE